MSLQYGQVYGTVDPVGGYIQLRSTRDSLNLGNDQETVWVGVDSVYFRAYVDAYAHRLTPVGLEFPTALLRGLGDLADVVVKPVHLDHRTSRTDAPTIDTRVVPAAQTPAVAPVAARVVNF